MTEINFPFLKYYICKIIIMSNFLSKNMEEESGILRVLKKEFTKLEFILSKIIFQIGRRNTDFIKQRTTKEIYYWQTCPARNV